MTIILYLVYIELYRAVSIVNRLLPLIIDQWKYVEGKKRLLSIDHCSRDYSRSYIYDSDQKEQKQLRLGHVQLNYGVWTLNYNQSLLFTKNCYVNWIQIYAAILHLKTRWFCSFFLFKDTSLYGRTTNYILFFWYFTNYIF